MKSFGGTLGILAVDLKRGWNILYLEIEPVRFTLGKQSFLAPESVVEAVEIESEDGEEGDVIDIDPRIMLMYSANEGDIEGIKELLDSGTDVNFRDDVEKTALHVVACQQDQNLLPEFDFDHKFASSTKFYVYISLQHQALGMIHPYKAYSILHLPYEEFR
ncbi:hypothetical protein CQW23_04058 [Capsicum baccatum]|uniref:Uncharacterized protein n=1 Tax=Capsicum baccatum TaxID=33114 RepID=A0A2G2XDJ0_CAPBA|nr:hypothetical protein CQW23_04058 [Capsicum baccatum]